MKLGRSERPTCHKHSIYPSRKTRKDKEAFVLVAPHSVSRYGKILQLHHSAAKLYLCYPSPDLLFDHVPLPVNIDIETLSYPSCLDERYIFSSQSISLFQFLYLYLVTSSVNKSQMHILLEVLLKPLILVTCLLAPSTLILQGNGGTYPPHGVVTLNDRGPYVVITTWTIMCLMVLARLARLRTQRDTDQQWIIGDRRDGQSIN